MVSAFFYLHSCRRLTRFGLDGSIGLKNKAGFEITSKIKIDLSLIAESEDQFENFMATVSADASRLDGAIRIHPGILAFGRVLQLSKIIMDIAANVRRPPAFWLLIVVTWSPYEQADSSPILKASWGVMSAVYTVSYLITRLKP
jgi:hypothetical protein